MPALRKDPRELMERGARMVLQMRTETGAVVALWPGWPSSWVCILRGVVALGEAEAGEIG